MLVQFGYVLKCNNESIFGRKDLQIKCFLPHRMQQYSHCHNGVSNSSIKNPIMDAIMRQWGLQITWGTVQITESVLFSAWLTLNFCGLENVISDASLHWLPTIGFQSIEITKKVFVTFDNVFHVYLMRGFQKYGRN